MDEPESSRQRMHEAHRAGAELIARGARAKLVELAIDTDERGFVIGPGRFFEDACDLRKARALFGGCATRGASRDQAFHLAAHLEQSQLALDVDLRHDDAA